MRVLTLCEFECPTHKAAKGAVIDLPRRFSLAGVKAGQLEVVEENASKPSAKKQTATKRAPRKKAVKKTVE